MLKVSDKFLEAVKATKRTIKLRIKINDKTYTNDDINKFELDSGSMGGNSLGIGSTYANTVKIEFCSIIEGLKETDEIEVFMGVKIAGNDVIQPLENPFRVGTARIGTAQLVTQANIEYEYVPLGKFYIKGRVDPDRNENKTSIEAMDGWMFMEELYESQLNYPTPLRSVALEIANLSGIEIDQTSFNTISMIPVEKPFNYTYRQAMGIVAQAEGKYARFGRNGLLEIKALDDPNYTITTNEYFMKGLVKNEVLFRLGGISCKVIKRGVDGDDTTQTLHSGSEAGAQVKLENNIMTQVMLDNLYNKMKTINFYPYSLKWRGNPALEAGDWITLNDRKGNEFKVPNFNYKLNYSGGLTATSSADTQPVSDVVYKYKGPLTQVIDNMDQRIDAAGKNNVYDGIDEPPYPKEGDIWFKPNGPDKEIWIYVQFADGSMGWQKEVSTAPNDELLASIAESTKQANEAKNTADDAVHRANQAINDAWFANTSIDFLNGDISTIKTDVTGLQITVANKAEQSQITQLAGQITSAVIDIEGNKSQITQLSDGINLRVSKDDVINQINISPESILISGKKVQITGDTYIENGIITSAKIKDLTADKINAGTLNAANVNIINLNAKSISTGIAQGKNMSINFDTGSINFQSGNITNILGKININLDKSLIYLKNNSANISNVIGDNGFVVYSGIPTTSNVEVYDDNIIAAVGKFNGRPGLICNGQLEVASYKYKKLANGQISYYTAGGFVVESNGDATIFPDQNRTLQIGYLDTKTVLMSRNNEIPGSLTVGNLNISGVKNAIHVTRDGVRATPAYETAESYLGDIGEDTTDFNCECVVKIETLFGDTVNTTIPYQVFLSSYSNDNIWVEKRTPDSFIVKSDKPNAAFAWEIKAKRRGYETDRLVLDNSFNYKKIEEIYIGA